MSLIHCKECTKEFSDRAKKCPHCGAPPPWRAGPGTVILLALFAVFALFVAAGISAGGSREPDPNNPPTQASIRAGVTTLSVTNKNTYAWQRPTIHLNGRLRGYAYQWPGSIQPGEQVEIGLANFVKGDQRFQPLEMAVEEVVIAVRGRDSSIYRY